MRACVLLIVAAAFWEANGSTIGIIGGADSPPLLPSEPAYAALVSSSGVVTNLPVGPDGIPSDGFINGCAINGSGIGLIGGRYGALVPPTVAYGAFVSSSGAVTNLPNGGGAGNLPSPGEILSCAINPSSLGLVAGTDGSVNSAYAAFVSLPNRVSNLPVGVGALPSSGYLNHCAINASGVGLIGGRDTFGLAPAYAAFVAQSGTVTNLPNAGGADNLPSIGEIVGCAINRSSIGLVCGQDQGMLSAFAAFVTQPNTVNVLPVGLTSLPAPGSIFSCAINDSGLGLIGGIDQSGIGPAYAAFVSQPNTVNNLPNAGGAGNLPSQGHINSCAINSDGVGLIGGQDLSVLPNAAYAAIVSQTGGVLNLPVGPGNLPLDGEIISCAISDEGIGLIGGRDNSLIPTGPVYAAIVSPTGIVTNLPNGLGGLPTYGNINSVANTVLESLAPTSIGSYGSPINSLLAASFALESHVVMHHEGPRTRRVKDDSISLLADASSTLPLYTCIQEKKYALWAEPFGDYIHAASQDEIPSFSNEIGGILVAFDAHVRDHVFGGGLAYSFNYVDYSKSLGHAKINEELGVLYASFQLEKIFIHAAVWGGLYQLYNERHSLGFITSSAHTQGWLLSPHLEISASKIWNWFTLTPFVMADWANGWQRHFTEHGSSGLNLSVRGQYASLLRSEAGLRFYEDLNFCWGRLLIEESLSYVNQTPFHVQSINTFFVGSISSFSVATGSSKMENMYGVQLHCSFDPYNKKYPSLSLHSQANVGSSYESYFVALELDKNF